tara:strand:- start:3014 stop:4891 length:1878 start_codon:yes stop_codon:yes gene_type:complete
MLITIKNIIGSIRNVLGVVTDGLKMWLPFESIEIVSSVQVAPDTSGNSNNATLYTGKALSFDGNNDYVTADDFAGTLSNNTAFTIVMWFKSNQVSQSQPYQNIQMSGLESDGATNVFKFGASANSTVKGIHYQDTPLAPNNYKINNTVNYNDNVWHRLVISRPSGTNPQTANFYVDGVNIGNCPSQIEWDQLSKFSIGQEYDAGNTPSDFFKGEMSDVQIYNAEWTQADVTYDYNNPNHLVTDNPSTSISLSNLKGYWHLSEGTGSSAYNSAVALGSELVDKGDFDGITQAENTTGSDWTTEAGWTISGGTANCNNTSGSTQELKTTNRLVNLGGKNVKITFTVSGYSGSASMSVTLEGTGGTDFTGINANRTYSKVVSLGSNENSVDLFFKASNGWVGSVGNVSIKEVRVGTIKGASWSPRQATIPQLGFMDWSKPTIGSDVVTLIANPNDPSKDILGNSVRLREHSFNLDGSGYAKADSDSSLDITNYSIDGWVYNTNNSSTWEAILTKLNKDNFEIYIRNSQIRYYNSTDSEKVLANITLNAWTYFCITESSGTLKCYINDDSTPKSTHTITPRFSNSGPMYIGSNQSGDYSNALIDDIRVYNGVLSSDEVTQNYNAGLSKH